MSEATFDAEPFSGQSQQDADRVASSASSAQKPGLFTRILDAIGRAYSVELPNGEILFVPPF
jgi:hypothetical protein